MGRERSRVALEGADQDLESDAGGLAVVERKRDGRHAAILAPLPTVAEPVSRQPIGRPSSVHENYARDSGGACLMKA